MKSHIQDSPAPSGSFCTISILCEVSEKHLAMLIRNHVQTQYNGRCDKNSCGLGVYFMVRSQNRWFQDRNRGFTQLCRCLGWRVIVSVLLLAVLLKRAQPTLSSTRNFFTIPEEEVRSFFRLRRPKCSLFRIYWSVISLQRLLSHFSASKRAAALAQSREMFYWGWDNYMQYAFPADELDPIHCTGRGHDHERPSVCLLSGKCAV